LTILGGLVFVGSQAWEWANFISGEYGAVETRSGKILQFVDATNDNKRISITEIAMGERGTERTRQNQSEGIWYMSEKDLPSVTLQQVKTGFEANENLLIRTMTLNEEGEKTVLDRETSLDYLNNRGIGIIEGANLTKNEYGAPLFADFFFFITGFHGFHVFSGVVILCIIFFNVLIGTYERRGSYEMVEKVGLYWHFVDLVWVFVFTFFYLV